MKEEVPRLPPVEGEPIPQWDLGHLERRDCIVCRGTKHAAVCFRPDGLLVAQCTQCGTLFLPLVPGARDLEAFYRSYSSKKHYLQPQPVERPPFLIRGRIRLVGIARTVLLKIGAWRYLQRIRPLRVSDTGRILLHTGGLEGKTLVELGPGPRGGFLPEAGRLGAEAIGVEVDPGAADRVADMGFKVCSSLASVPGPVDVLVASHVFEHLTDPLSVLREMAGLSRRGTRVFIETPNGGQAVSVGPSWIGYREDLEHLNYFTERSLSMSLLQAGFYAECLWTKAQPVLPYYLGRNGGDAPARETQQVPERRQAIGEGNLVNSFGSFALTVLARFEGRPAG